MATITTKRGQTLIDIGNANCGSVEASIAIAFANSLSVTAKIEANTLMQLPGINNKTIVSKYQVEGISPATAPTISKVFGNQFSTEFE